MTRWLPIKLPVFWLILISTHILILRSQNSVMEYYLEEIGQSYSAVTPFYDRSLLGFTLENRYLLKELMHSEFLLQGLYKKNAFLFSSCHFGYAHYGEFSCSVGYARILAKPLAVGINFYYLLDYAFQYRSSHSVTFDFSLYARINENIGMAISIYNPARLKYGVIGQSLIPMEFEVNLYYKMDKKLLFYCDVSKLLPGYLNIKWGGYYRPMELFCFSLMASLKELALNIGLYWRRYTFRFSSSFHYNLGLSPSFKLTYSF
ncbi:MAG: hypothetical protein RR356_04675 [Bacteroidales bacterium]